MRSSTTDGKTFTYELINSLYKESLEQYTAVRNLIKSNKVSDIIDFDDHFDDANLDWRNTFIENLIKK